jgi:flagellar FliL protein
MAEATKEATESKKKKLPIPIIAGVVVLLLVLFFAKGMLGGHKSDAKEKKKEAKVGISLSLDEFLVNLSGGGDHYLRATISLGMAEGVAEEKAKEHVAPMRDAILAVLSAKTLKDLSSAKGRDDLKEELKAKINAASGEDQVVKVYFTAFATQ